MSDQVIQMARQPWNVLGCFQKSVILALVSNDVTMTFFLWFKLFLGDRYNNAHPNSKPFNLTAYKGKQMMVSGNNKHSACQSGYFEPKFSRILEAEVGFYIDH